MILQGDCRLVMQQLEPESFHCCITSPLYYGLRDYGVDGQLGLESTPEEYVQNMVEVFKEVKRVLRKDGTLWLNLGDSYFGSGKGKNADGSHTLGGKQDSHPGSFKGTLNKPAKSKLLKPKDLIGIPWRVAFALQTDGWYLRSDIIWHKPNAMPSSVTDRPTTAHEYIFLLSKSKNYYYDLESIKEPLAESSVARLAQDVENQTGSVRANGGAKTNGNMKAVGGSKGAFGPEQSRTRAKQDETGNRNYTGLNERYTSPETRNKRSVWTVATAQMSEAHFAVFPEKLIEPCVLAGCLVGGRILDPFGGSGTTRKVALENNRECTLIDINPDYTEMQERRTAIIQPKLF